MCQLVVSIIFFTKTRRIEEVGNLPKLMIVLSNFSWILYLVHYVQLLIGIKSGFSLSVLSLLAKLPQLVNYGLLIRFVRVQVQLRAREERTEVIIAKIARSRKIEKFIHADLVVYSLCFFTYYYPQIYTDVAASQAAIMQYSLAVAAITQLIFVCIFC